MPRLIQNYKSYYLIPDGSNEIYDSIPDGSFEVKYDALQRQFYLYKSEQISIPDKVYGNQESIADKIIKTYNAKQSNCGVLLTGTKGTGKTMLSKLISHKANIPTLIVNRNFATDDLSSLFTTFIQDINQRCIIIFDEFEKYYDDQGQEKLLTILDGMSNSNKLFIFTANKEYKICEFLLNRPGRILFHIRYEKLDLESTKQYCFENLKSQAHLSEVLQIRDNTIDFNFDIMKALVDYCNFHEESPNEAVKILNIGDYKKYNFFDYEIILEKEPDKKYRGTSGPHNDRHSFHINHKLNNKKSKNNNDYDDEDDDDIISVYYHESAVVDIKDGWTYCANSEARFKIRKSQKKSVIDF